MQVLVDNFEVFDIDKEGKLYANVSRGYLQAKDIRLTLDYHSTLCKLKVGNIVEIRLFLGFESRVECDYLIFGKVYRVEDTGNGMVLLKASFGGLLLILSAQKNRISSFGDRNDISLALIFS